jgi:hypothetical protein
MMAVVDYLIVALLAVLVVLEILRPRRMRALLDEVDQRTEAATAALDRAQQHIDQTMQELAAERARQEAEAPAASAPGPEPARQEANPTRRRSSAAARYRQEADSLHGGGQEEDEEVRSLREEVARRLERSPSERSHRERRLLAELQETLDMEAGPDRDSQEKALYQALQKAMEEPAPRKASAVPAEEHKLIEKLRGDG